MSTRNGGDPPFARTRSGACDGLRGSIGSAENENPVPGPAFRECARRLQAVATGDGRQPGTTSAPGGSGLKAPVRLPSGGSSV